MCTEKEMQQVQYIEAPSTECDLCHVIKPDTEFGSFSTYWCPAGKHRWCRSCRSIHLASYDSNLVAHLTTLFLETKAAIDDHEHPGYTNWGALGIEDHFYSVDEFIEHVNNGLNITSVAQIKDLVVGLIYPELGNFESGNIQFVIQVENDKQIEYRNVLLGQSIVRKVN